MKKCLPFYLVNVFADTPFGGNPLAVFDHADDLTDAQMLAITRQFNLSETVFMRHGLDHQTNVRIFSPMGEMSFAGHPTLGAAFVRHHHHGLPHEFMIHTIAKPISVRVHDDVCSFGMTDTKTKDILCDDFVDTLKLHPHQIQRAHVADCGIRQLIVQVADRSALSQTKVDLGALRHLCDVHGTPEVFVYVWCVGDGVIDDGVIYARSFFEQDGMVVQDAGTGSACANVGAVLSSTQKYADYTIHQGDDILKPCRLSLTVKPHQLDVGGRVQLMGQGEFYL